MLEKLVDNIMKSKLKVINLDKESTILKNQGVLSKDEDNNNNKGSEKAASERKNKEEIVKADRGEEADLGKMKVDDNVNEAGLESVEADGGGEAPLDNPSAGKSSGFASSQKDISTAGAIAEKGGIFLVVNVQLQGR